MPSDTGTTLRSIPRRKVCPMANEKHRLPEDIPRTIKYIDIDLWGVRKSFNFEGGWGEFYPVARCVHCGRYTEDPAKDAEGNPLPDYLFDSEEAKRPECTECLSEKLGEAMRKDILQILEETLGLGETDRTAIRAFIDTIFTDPKKILKVQELENRVSSLERQTTALWVALGVAVALLTILATLTVAL